MPSRSLLAAAAWAILAHVANAADAVQVDVYLNSALAGSPASSLAFPTLDLSFPAPGLAFSAEVTTTIAFPDAPAYYVFGCSLDPALRTAFVWIDDHLVCTSALPYISTSAIAMDGTEANPIYRRPAVARGAVVRAHLYYAPPPEGPGEALQAHAGVSAAAVFGLSWCQVAVPNGTCTLGPIAPAALTAGIPPAEATRVALQRGLTAGWAQWLHGDWLAVVGLPSSVKFKIVLCQISTGDCLLRASINNLRLGLRAYDNSIAQTYVSYFGLNVSLSVLGGTGGLSILVEPIACVARRNVSNCSDWAVAVTGSIAWARAGSVAAALPDGGGPALVASPFGFPQFTLFASAGAVPVPPSSLPINITRLPHVAVSLGSGGAGGIAFAVGDSPPAVDAVRSAAASAAAVEAARYAHYGVLAEVAGATQAAVAWMMVFTPAELGPFPPVSRGWDFARIAPGEPAPEDWSYVIFDWDNLFGALILGATTRDSAYSALIQVVRSKTAAGFVPNFAAGGAKSQDRSEPPVGARVLAALYAKYGDGWLVDLLLDDLVDWLDWFWRRRQLEGVVGAGPLLCLGSDAVAGYTQDSSNSMQTARYESGLDNSPMYDTSFYNATSHHMLAADVGMSSLFVAEADALADLAAARNRSADAVALRARADAVRSAIAASLWDEARGAFVNRFAIGANNTLSARVSPTSFYALAARAATDAQAARFAAEWALNASRFCLSAEWPAGVSDDCFWGLPSISADDPAFPALGYWRGYVWGPMAQLAYWSLSAYAHVPAVATAQAALAAQMSAMMVNQWRLNRHVCENFSPHRNATDCTGDHFYHWGALGGLIALQQAGVY